jgi:hypothetical protein
MVPTIEPPAWQLKPGMEAQHWGGAVPWRRRRSLCRRSLSLAHIGGISDQLSETPTRALEGHSIDQLTERPARS